MLLLTDNELTQFYHIFSLNR